VADYRQQVINVLLEHGCEFVRHANGSHDLWQSPISNKRFVVQLSLKSRNSANNILKQAGIDAKI
jgi:predicted RNA binding protein YcfA (HicA-like mRNA interferase family)